MVKSFDTVGLLFQKLKLESNTWKLNRVFLNFHPFQDTSHHHDRPTYLLQADDCWDGEILTYSLC
jgi:hypothetical protein